MKAKQSHFERVPQPPKSVTREEELLCGIDRLVADSLSILQGKRVGLIANPTSVDKGLVHTVDRLSEMQSSADFSLSALFAPEHGLHGNLPPTVSEGHRRDPRSGLKVWSLYSETRRPTSEMLDEIDVLLFDLQDVGTRYYSFIWTMYNAMCAASVQKKKFIVLDRPNPLGPYIDGPILDPSFSSFIGLEAIALQHGLTVGELARLFNEEFLPEPVELEVVQMSGHNLTPTIMDWQKAWVPPSPNLPHISTVWAHAATGLFDGTTASHGEGTTLPFEWVGHPSISEIGAYDLADDLNKRELPGVTFRPMFAVPSAGKCKGRVCGGVQLHIYDPSVMLPLRVGVHMLSAFFKLSEIEWRAESDLHTREDNSDVLWIDRLFGNRQLRLNIDRGISAYEICAEWDPSRFVNTAEKYRLYPVESCQPIANL